MNNTVPPPDAPIRWGGEYMTKEDQREDVDGSRRSFMEKGALASGAAALGLSGSGTATADANVQQSLGTGLVFVDDYDPGVPFTVTSRIQQPTVNDILGEQQEGQAVVDPTDYNGYLVHDQCNEQAPGSFSLVFTREETLETNQDYSFTNQAVIFSSELYLIEAQLERVQAGGGGNATDGGQDG